MALFTREELEALRIADEEIDAEFSLTNEDLRFSRKLDKDAKFERLDNRGKRAAAQQAAYYEANREKIAAQQAAYREANYDRMYGCHSVHIPSLALPRDYQESAYVNVLADSEGYVVDVYENHIVLRGRDFAMDKFMPIATFCIDTTPEEIPAGTYTDSTGTITT